MRFNEPLTAGSRRWMTQASCRDSDPEVFFPLTERGASEARRLCVGCAVRDDCLAFALRNRIHDGVWGGMSERERRALLLGSPLGVGNDAPVA